VKAVNVKQPITKDNVFQYGGYGEYGVVFTEVGDSGHYCVCFF
jgi:hypothetical protein